VPVLLHRARTSLLGLQHPLEPSDQLGHAEGRCLPRLAERTGGPSRNPRGAREARRGGHRASLADVWTLNVWTEWNAGRRFCVK
jgi:hypothetical protein